MRKKVSLGGNVSEDEVDTTIRFIRGKKVILDRDLAYLYGVQTKVLNQAVKRNIKRFPEDFMFQLSDEEFGILTSQGRTSRSQFVTLKQGQNIKYRPYAFTEQGVAMLSGLLNSERAIQVNIAIMRAFVKLRAMLAVNKELAQKLEELERKVESHDKAIAGIFEAIRQLMKGQGEGPITNPASNYKGTRIGFKTS